MPKVVNVVKMRLRVSLVAITVFASVYSQSYDSGRDLASSFTPNRGNSEGRWDGQFQGRGGVSGYPGYEGNPGSNEGTWSAESRESDDQPSVEPWNPERGRSIVHFRHKYKKGYLQSSRKEGDKKRWTMDYYGTVEQPQVQPKSIYGTVEQPQVQPKSIYGTVEQPQFQPESIYGAVEQPQVQPEPIYGTVVQPQVQPESTYGTVEQPQVQPEPIYGTVEQPQVQPESISATVVQPQIQSTYDNVTEPQFQHQLINGSVADICGLPVIMAGRIVGGEDATYGQYPWQISLKQWTGSEYFHKCGGAVLNENWVITASHCVKGNNPSDLLLQMGEHDFQNNDELYAPVERRVDYIFMHKKYNPKTYENDVALLRIKEPIAFQPNIIPICLPEDDFDFVKEKAFATGWGRLYADGPVANILQVVSVPVLPNSDCETMYKASGQNEKLPSYTFLCAGYEEGKRDSCTGDSGGPLVINRKGRWRLAGLISWGIGCAEAKHPGIYTRVSSFRDWINNFIQY